MAEYNPESSEQEVLITVTRSAGDDRAVLVFIDTNFDPTDNPGLRVLVNDDEAYVGKAYEYGAEHEADDRKFRVLLSEVPYHEPSHVAVNVERDPYTGTYDYNEVEHEEGTLGAFLHEARLPGVPCPDH